MLPATIRRMAVVSDTPDRALVLFAHPDDAEIGCGGVVARWLAAGCEVTYVLCTNGSAGTGDRSLTPAALVETRQTEQRAAAEFLGVKNLVTLDYPDGGLEDTRELRGHVVRAIRKFRPYTVLTHDPHRIRSFQHRDHRMVGIVATDAVYPFARDHLHFPEHITDEGLEPHKVRELWYWGADEPDVIVDVTDSIDRQIAALVRHESQVGGLSMGPDETIEHRVKARAAELAMGYGFKYGEAFRRLIARR
jgi:LmbE family N-acetylglucosaminyl deacetylase